MSVKTAAAGIIVVILGFGVVGQVLSPQKNAMSAQKNTESVSVTSPTVKLENIRQVETVSPKKSEKPVTPQHSPIRQNKTEHPHAQKSRTVQDLMNAPMHCGPFQESFTGSKVAYCSVD